MASTVFDSIEEKEVRRIALAASGIRSSGSATSSLDAIKRKIKSREIKRKAQEQREVDVRMRKLGIAGVGAAFAFGGGASAALVAGALAGGKHLKAGISAIRAKKITAFEFFGKGVLRAAAVFATGAFRAGQGAEAERIRAFRRARGRPDAIGAEGESRTDILGKTRKAGIVTEDNANALLNVTLETNRAVGQGFGANSLSVATTEARRAFSAFRGSDANKNLAKTITVMEDRFNKELQKGWKVGPPGG